MNYKKGSKNERDLIGEVDLGADVGDVEDVDSAVESGLDVLAQRRHLRSIYKRNIKEKKDQYL